MISGRKFTVCGKTVFVSETDGIHLHVDVDALHEWGEDFPRILEWYIQREAEIATYFVYLQDHFPFQFLAASHWRLLLRGDIVPDEAREKLRHDFERWERR